MLTNSEQIAVAAFKSGVREEMLSYALDILKPNYANEMTIKDVGLGLQRLKAEKPQIFNDFETAKPLTDYERFKLAGGQ